MKKFLMTILCEVLDVFLGGRKTRYWNEKLTCAQPEENPFIRVTMSMEEIYSLFGSRRRS